MLVHDTQNTQVYHRQWIRNGQELLFIAAVYRKSDWAPYLLLPDLHGCHMHLAANVLRWCGPDAGDAHQLQQQPVSKLATMQQTRVLCGAVDAVFSLVGCFGLVVLLHSSNCMCVIHDSNVSHCVGV